VLEVSAQSAGWYVGVGVENGGMGSGLGPEPSG